jgi:phosphatidylinositol alpha-1,6-mannosyltransferase
MRVERTRQPVLLPEPWLRRHIDALAADVDADLVLLDPALPLGLIGPAIERPYGVVLHGAEVTIPGRLPGGRQLLAHVLRGAALVVAAGGYPADEGARAAGRTLPTVVVPPGVDTTRFVPLGPHDRRAARDRFGLDPAAPLVLSVSRLVPRKGMDVLVRAAAAAARHVPGLQVAIAGDGRERGRLDRLVDQTGAPVRMLGRVADDELPLLYGCADVFAMLCRDRWLGLEQEGFGIVFLEAAACAVPQVAGRSGGSHEAVEHGVTGLVVDDPRSVSQTAAALTALLTDEASRVALGEASRRRAVEQFTYDGLAAQLQVAIDAAMVAP